MSWSTSFGKNNDFVEIFCVKNLWELNPKKGPSPWSWKEETTTKGGTQLLSWGPFSFFLLYVQVFLELSLVFSLFGIKRNKQVRSSKLSNLCCPSPITKKIGGGGEEQDVASPSQCHHHNNATMKEGQRGPTLIVFSWCKLLHNNGYYCKLATSKKENKRESGREQDPPYRHCFRGWWVQCAIVATE